MQRRACLVLGTSILLSRGGRAAGTHPLVILRTAGGAIAIELFADRAPVSAAAFLAVVEAGGYDNGAFTRTVRPDNDHGTPPISVVQASAATAAAPIRHEGTDRTGLRHVDATVSLPRDGVGTATGAAFFVCVGDQPALDFGGSRNRDGQGFAAFGRVLSGMDEVRRIWRLASTGASPDRYTAGQMLAPPVRITDARVG